MTLTHCIADNCGIAFDTDIPEQRNNLRSFWYRYCPKHRAQGNAGSEVIVNNPAPAPHPKYIDTTWELRSYDVWGNARDGYEVNNTFRAGEVTIRCKVQVNNAGTPQEFMSAYPSDSQIRKALGLSLIHI